MNFYLYAETAFHHEGSKNYLIRLIDEAKEAGAHGVKFQVLIELNEFMSSAHSAYEEAKNWILSLDDWIDIFKYTKKQGLDIILMPLDVKAFGLVEQFEIKYIEIHSVSFKDKRLLSKLDENSIPLILGIGGRTLHEIDQVVRKYKDRNITLMVGFQSYPSALEDIKLLRIKELAKMYAGCVIGYADHSSFSDDMAIASNEFAYILGARVFEKHISLKEGEERIDFQSAISARKIKIIKSKLIYLEQLLNMNNSKIFEMNEKERVYRNRQKIPVATHDLEVGHMLTKHDFTLKMVDATTCIENMNENIGKKIKAGVCEDEPFREGVIAS